MLIGRLQIGIFKTGKVKAVLTGCLKEIVRRKKIVVLLGSNFLDIRDGNETHPLAYESQTPKSGGYALMLVGNAKLVTPEEFDQIPRAPQTTTD